MYEQPNQHKTSRIVSTLITIVVIAFVAFILWWLYQNFFATPSKPNTNATTQPSATNMSDKDFTAKVESAVRELGYDDKYVKLNTANWATTPQQGNILISGSVSSQSVTANSFEGGSFNGTSFSGNGSNLTNLNATNLNSGIISTNLLPGSGSITCPSGVGNLTGGGNQATLGGAVCGAISTITNPTFSQVTSTTIDTNNLNTTSLTTTTLTTNNLSAQTIATSNLNANTITGTNLNITNISSTGNITAVSFAGDGSNLTDLNANNITSGTLAVSQGGTGTNSFTLNGVLYGNGTSSLQSTLASTGPNQCLITLTAGGAPTWGSCASGGGVTTAGGTNNTIAMFNSSGTIANSLLTQDVGATTVTTTGNANITGTATANAFSGNGSGLTNLNATNIASGTIDDARLSNNVALLNNTQTLTGAKTFSALLTATNGLSVTGTMVGTSTIQGTQLISTIATGTAPLQVASTTQIANLNADLLDGYTASDFAQASALGNYVLKAGDTMTGNLNMGTNKLIGGTGVTDILKLQSTTGNGTLTSAAIQLLTGNNGGTTALTVLNNGNVGIGTTSPTNPLHVAINTVTNSPIIQAQNINTGGGAVIGIDRANNPRVAGLQYSTAGSINWVTGMVYNAGVAENGYSISTDATLANTKLYVSTAGNVGIGTTSPSAKLHINDNNPVIYVEDSDFPAEYVLLANGGGNGYLRTVGNKPFYLGTNDSPRLTIAADGNVGIGTTTPGAKLQVDTGASTTIGQIIKGAASQTADLLQIQDSSANKLMVVSSGGNVGIGVAAPATPLEVNGIVRADRTAVPAQYIQLDGGDGNNTALRAVAANKFLYIDNSDTSGTNLYNAIVFRNGTAGDTERMRVDANGNVGIANTSPSYLLHVGSSAVTTGTSVAQFENAGGTCTITPSTAGGISCTSDERLKKDITKLDTTTTLDKLLGISTISYHMNNDTGGSPLKVGFSAQQLETILPDLVVTGADGYKSVSYAGLTPYLVAGMQAQQQTINSLKQDIQTLQAATGINSNQVTIANLNVSGPTTLKDLTVTGNLNITGSLTLAGTLTVKDLTLTSNLTIGGHIITAGNTPTITPQAAAGQGATATIEGNDTSGVITIVAGSDATIGDVIDTTFAQQFGAIPKVTLTPVGPDSAKIQAYISSPSAGSFKVGSVLAPTAGTTYTFNYQIMQ